MKRAAFVGMLLAFSAGLSQAQELHKGNVVGVHVMTIKLQPGVTMDQFTAFYMSKVVPAYAKSRPAWKAYPVRRIRGEKAEGFGLLLVIGSEAERDKYYNADGSDTELGKASMAKIQPVIDEMNKLGTIAADPYIDWLVYR